MISLLQLQQRPHVSLTEAGVIPVVLPVALSLHLHMLVTETLVTLMWGCRTHPLCTQGSWNSGEQMPLGASLSQEQMGNRWMTTPTVSPMSWILYTVLQNFQQDGFHLPTMVSSL